MVVLVLIVLAAALLTHGVLTERPVEVIIAGALSALGIVAVVVDRRLSGRKARGDSDSESEAVVPALAIALEKAATAHEPESAPERLDDVSTDAEAPDFDVVFVAGRTTFHASSCAAVEGRIVSVGNRSQLERGGMTACRRCLPAL